MRIRFFSSLVCILFVSLSVTAQSLDHAKEESLEKQLAINTLLSVTSEMKGLQDLQLRVSLAESIVPLLSKSRPIICREMLDIIFDEALAKKRDSKLFSTNNNSNEKIANLDSVIRALIKVAAKLDGGLAKRYIQEYTAEKESQEKEKSSLSDDLKMKLAIAMVEDDPNAAISLATQALRSGVTDDYLIFLAALRRKNIPLADSFAVTVARSIETRQARNDVNELFYIFAYILTPQLVPTVRIEGLAFSNIIAYQEIADNYSVNPSLAQQYFHIGARVILQQNRYTALSVDVLAERALADFLYISLLDAYTTSLFPQISAKLLQRKSQIIQYLQPQQITQLQSQVGRWQDLQSRIDIAKSKSNPRDSEFFSNRADQEKDLKLRDRFYYQAASTAVREKKLEKAQSLIENISSQNREKAQEYLSFQIALQSISEGKIELAENFLLKQYNLIRRAYLLTLMADFFVQGEQKDTGRASELLTEAIIIASQLTDDRNQASVLFGCTQIYSRFDEVRAFETLQKAIDAANKVKDFDGDTRVPDGFELSGFYFSYALYSANLTFNETIDHLAMINFSEIIQNLKSLKPVPIRLQASVLSCKSSLLKNEMSSLKN